MDRPTLLVFGDSLSFHGPAGPVPSDEPRLWANVAASMLGLRAELAAGFGWTAREAYWSLTGDPRVWSLLPSARAVVLAVGGMDTLPSPLPTYLRQGLRYLRPDPLRRVVRRGYLAAQPWLSRALRGRPVALPPSVTAAYLDRCVAALRALMPDLPIVGVLPSLHRAKAYGLVHTGRDRAVPVLRAWGERAGVPLIDLAELTGQHVLSGAGNPDGMHWGWAGHDAVGKAVAGLLGPVLGPGLDDAAR